MRKKEVYALSVQKKSVPNFFGTLFLKTYKVQKTNILQ